MYPCLFFNMLDIIVSSTNFLVYPHKSKAKLFTSRELTWQLYNILNIHFTVQGKNKDLNTTIIGQWNIKNIQTIQKWNDIISSFGKRKMCSSNHALSLIQWRVQFRMADLVSSLWCKYCLLNTYLMNNVVILKREVSKYTVVVFEQVCWLYWYLLLLYCYWYANLFFAIRGLLRRKWIRVIRS